jgi:hypothetical protein
LGTLIGGISNNLKALINHPFIYPSPSAVLLYSSS